MINQPLKKEGFTLIEILVVLAIIGILTAIIISGVAHYINRSKDSNIMSNLGVLILAGEVYYNNNNNSYEGFCKSSVVNNVRRQLPVNPAASCYDEQSNKSGLCCREANNQWAACVRKFVNPRMAYCVDSRGIRKEIDSSECSDNIIQCP